MVKRLFVGLFLGLVVGLMVAAALTHALHLDFTGGMGAALAYVAAACTGMLTGLVTGKPIWSSNGKVEAGLKAFFGALMAAGMMFALRRWLPLQVNLGFLQAGSGSAGELPYASLPVVAALLGGFFEVDNTPESHDAQPATGPRVRIDPRGEAEGADDESDHSEIRKSARR